MVLVAGVYGVFVSQDLFIFFLFYELAVLPMYLLIGIWGSSGKIAEAGPFRWVFRMLDVGGKEYAAMKLTLMLLLGSAFILAAMLGMYFEAGQTFSMQSMLEAQFSTSLQMLAFPALWIGFGTLGGLWPFHTWSPDGHAAAPTAVSMLHAGVLMKLGAFGVIRVGMLLLPEGAQAWAFIVGTVAVINIVYGALCAMNQKDLKYIIAYSSVSHMGVVLLGAATLTTNGWNGAIFQMVAHGIMTAMFFALVGFVYGRTHDRWVPNLGGLGKVMPYLAGFFTLAALSSLGMPGTAGFVAEFLVFLGAWQGAYSWWAVPGAMGAFITAVYVLRATGKIFWGEGPPSKFADLTDANGVEHITLWILGISIIVLGLWPRVLLDLIDAATPAYLAAVTTAGVMP
jgi:NADH-quinone oxidoreductase subunit M